MSTRERWIVYPLLFLTLGIALRDKVAPPERFLAREIGANQIRCDRLLVGGLLCEQAQIAQNAKIRQLACESLLVNGPDGKPVVAALVDPKNGSGLFEVLSEKHSPLVQLHATDGNGMITTLDRQGKALVMGYLGENFGVFAHIPGVGMIVPLTQPWRVETKRPPPDDAKKPGAEAQPTPPEKDAPKSPRTDPGAGA